MDQENYFSQPYKGLLWHPRSLSEMFDKVVDLWARRKEGIFSVITKRGKSHGQQFGGIM